MLGALRGKLVVKKNFWSPTKNIDSNIYRHLALTWRLVSRSISLSLTWGTWALKRTGTWWKSWSEVRSVYEGRTLNWDMFTESITDTRRQEYYLCFYNKFELGVLFRMLSRCCYMLCRICAQLTDNWDLALSRHKSIYSNLGCISLTTSDCCNFLCQFTISSTDSGDRAQSRCDDKLSPRGPEHDWACLQPVGCCNQSGLHTGDTGQPSLDTPLLFALVGTDLTSRSSDLYLAWIVNR